jgi:parallel beta-helix repeat protein
MRGMAVIKLNSKGGIKNEKVFLSVIIFLLGLCLSPFAFAEMLEENPLPPDNIMPGRVEGTGTHFEIINSDYLNITLDSTEPIKLTLESVPEMVTMHIESVSDATSTQITLSGFQPLTTYYKYEDDYHNEEVFTTDGNGSYTWTQDLSQQHLVFIQPRASTKFIKDDATGGDCYLIGIWDSVNKTCTLTTDVYETIQIDSNYITLDGNGHTITGTGTGYGVYLPRRTGVTIKNLNVKQFSSGIHLYRSSSSTNTLAGNITSLNYWAGILLLYSSNNTLTGNNASDNYYHGIYLGSYSSNNTLTDNIASDNKYGIYLFAYSNNNILTGNNASKNYWFGIALSSSSSNNILTGNTASGNSLTPTPAGILGVGIWLYSTSNNTLTGNNASDNYYGIVLENSSNNTLIDNIAQENRLFDMWVSSVCNNVIQGTIGSGGRPIKYYSNPSTHIENETLSELILCNANYSNINNVIIDGSATLNNNGLVVIYTDQTIITNTISLNNYYGIYLHTSSNNTLTDNIASGNYYGIFLYAFSDNNILTGNNASNNSYQGINLLHSSNNTLTDNIALGNKYGFGVIAIYPYYSYYSSNNTLTGNNASNNSYGIWLQNTINITLTSNTVCNNYIYDFYCSGCNILAESGNMCDKLYGCPISCMPCVPADTTPPTTTAVLSGTLGDNGWYTSDGQVTLTAVDNEGGSGVKKTEYSFDGITWNTYSAPFTIITEGITTLYYRSTDNAGNVETTKTTIVKIDKTPPEITITGVSEGGKYFVCNPPAPTYNVTDATSGVATSSATLSGGNANEVGTFTYKVTATDMAGNTATKTVTYKIIYSFTGGFQPPVTLGKPFKHGSTIPVKFELTDGCGNIVSTATAILTLQLYLGEEPLGDPIDATSNVPDSGNLFRFTEGHYIYNLSTDNLQVGTWLATVTLDDGERYSIFIGIK